MGMDLARLARCYWNFTGQFQQICILYSQNPCPCINQSLYWISSYNRQGLVCQMKSSSLVRTPSPQKYVFWILKDWPVRRTNNIIVYVKWSCWQLYSNHRKTNILCSFLSDVLYSSFPLLSFISFFLVLHAFRPNAYAINSVIRQWM